MAELERAFLHDILENPDDDAPRLVYADWLDEHGRAERAELIRVQCELARLDRYDPRWPALRRREGELLAAHAAGWVEEVGLGELEEPRFRRGFVEHAAFNDCLEYLAQAGRLLRRVPLSGATFGALGGWDDETGQSAGLRKLLGSRHVRPLRRLEFHTIAELCEADLALLSRFPSSACLEELDLSHNTLDDAEVGVLARCPTLARLRVLSLAGNSFGVEGVQLLAASPHLTGLRELDLEAGRHGRFYAAGVGELVASPYLKDLTALSLRGQHIGSEGLSRLASWPGLERLARLDVSWNVGHGSASWDRDPAGVRRLVHSPHWHQLRELDVSGGTIGDLATLEMLLAAPNLPTLRVLGLGDFGDLTGEEQDEAARLVARAGTLGGLIELHFRGRGLGDAGRRVLRDRFGERLVLVG